METSKWFRVQPVYFQNPTPRFRQQARRGVASKRLDCIQKRQTTQGNWSLRRGHQSGEARPQRLEGSRCFVGFQRRHLSRNPTVSHFTVSIPLFSGSPDSSTATRRPSNTRRKTLSCTIGEPTLTSIRSRTTWRLVKTPRRRWNSARLTHTPRCSCKKSSRQLSNVTCCRLQDVYNTTINTLCWSGGRLTGGWSLSEWLLEVVSLQPTNEQPINKQLTPFQNTNVSYLIGARG